MAKRSSDPRVAYPEVTIQVQDLMQVGGITDLLPNVGTILGENSIYLDAGCKWAQETCAGCPPAEVRHGSQAKFRDGTVWGL